MYTTLSSPNGVFLIRYHEKTIQNGTPPFEKKEEKYLFLVFHPHLPISIHYHEKEEDDWMIFISFLRLLHVEDNQSFVLSEEYQ